MVSVARLQLTIYGDFNCPFSALASVRADALLAIGAYEIDWRAVQHDTALPAAGEILEAEAVAELTDEIATIRDLLAPEERVQLVVPRVRSNTAAASAAFAAAPDDDPLRRRLFAAVWTEARNVGDATELERLDAVRRDDGRARRWQDEFDALAQPVTPSLVLPDGEVVPGIDALARLARFTGTTP
jgi:predicted DsbA family dithiol-disulfide isomerase